MRRGRLLSIPLLSLYLAGVSAVVLNFGRERWAAKPWFPIAVGTTAALAILPLRLLLKQTLLDRSKSDWVRVVFFGFCGLLTLAPLPVLGRNDLLLICGMLGTSAIFWWACFGSLFQWPGFRPPPRPDECRCCRYDLTGNPSGVCPECGTPIDDGATA